jgi:multidrug efflux system outer membrane protein
MRKYLVGLLLLAQGCHLGPDYEVPSLPLPQGWKGETAAAPTPQVEFWWEVFEDETLSSLAKLVVRDNPDLYAALQRIEEARAVSGIAKSVLYPQASLQPNYNDTGELIELYGVPQGLFPGLQTITRVHEMSYALPLTMSYEVDIWQKNRGRYNVAKAYTEAELESYRASLLMLTSDLASDYFNAKTLDRQIALLSEKVMISQEMLRLRQLRYLSGLDNYVEVLTAIEQSEVNQAHYEDAVRQRRLFENAIGALIGKTASEFTLATDELNTLPPIVPAGVPSTLLIRRPDVAQAERKMAAAHALIGVAYASFYPAINLTGALGFLSPELGEFLTWGGRLWQWGAQIFQTVFDGKRRSSQLDFAKATFQETEGQYKKVILTAFREVEDALNNLEQEAKQADDYLRVWEAAGSTAAIFTRRFEVGVSSQLEVLSSRLQKIQAEQEFVHLTGLRYQATVQFIKALGGNWCSESTPAETDCGSAQGDDGDECHRPQIVQNDPGGQVLEKAPSGNNEEVAEWDEVGEGLHPLGHIFDGSSKAREER